MASGKLETEIRNDPETGEWLSRNEFMERTGVKERTLTNRTKKGYYKTRINEKGNVEVLFYPRHVEDKDPEIFQQGSGRFSGNIAGMQTVDPETNFQQEQKVFRVDPEFTRKEHCLNCERLQGQVDLLKEQLREVEKAHARLEGEMKGKDELLEERQKLVDEKDETIKAKEQAINAANGMVLLYEKQANPALPADSSVPENENLQVPAKVPGLVKALKSIFGG